MLRSTRLLHLSVKASYFAKKRNHHNNDFFIYAYLHRQLVGLPLRTIQTAYMLKEAMKEELSW